jgi:serine/threonine protein kinase
MPQHASGKLAHRAWIKQAHLQSDEAHRQATQAGLTLDWTRALLSPGDSFPGYELEREIHRGAQGAVYRAVQKSTGRRVALKLLHDHSFGGPLERARFEREMHVLAALNRPNIIAIHDGGSHGGRFFLVMDYIAGQPLDVYMASQPRSVRETLELFVPICDAVNGERMIVAFCRCALIGRVS